MATYKGVIEKATGDLLRVGYVDFENESSFNPSIEEVRTDVPYPGQVIYSLDFTEFHRWNGSSWVLITQPAYPDDPVTTSDGGTGYTSYNDGELLVGNSATGTLSKATLTEGEGIDISNGNGSITISTEQASISRNLLLMGS